MVQPPNSHDFTCKFMAFDPSAFLSDDEKKPTPPSRLSPLAGAAATRGESGYLLYLLRLAGCADSINGYWKWPFLEWEQYGTVGNEMVCDSFAQLNGWGFRIVDA